MMKNKVVIFSIAADVYADRIATLMPDGDAPIRSQDKQVCSKPISNTKVRIDGEEHTRFTEILEPAALKSLESLEACPVIFQEYVPKAYEIRATVIGDRVFAARIDSQAAGGPT